VSRYTPDSRERVRDAVDMLALVSARVELTRRGHDSYFGRCPFHDERTASFHVRPEEKRYHCFGCAESGDPFSFVMLTEGLDFKGALEALADRFGVTLQTEEEEPEAAARRQRNERLYALLDRAAAFYERHLWESAEAGPAREYLRQRGFEEAVLREFRIGWAPAAWDRLVIASQTAGFGAQELLGADLGRRKRAKPSELVDRFRARIMFPATDARGRVRGFGARTLSGDDGPKYLNTAEGDLYHKREVLYGIAQARAAAAREGRMVLCEGYTDVLALHQAGVHNAVGIMGTSLTDEQVAQLARLVGVLELCLDADAAGQRAMERAADVCAASGLELRVVELPAGSDPGELIAAQGAGALRERISDSRPYVEFRVRRLLESADTATAEGKDAAIAALREVLGPLQDSVQREQLVSAAAAALGVRKAMLARLLGPAGEAASAEQVPPGGAGEGGLIRLQSAPRPARAQRPEPERSLLAMCVAAPELGARALARVDPGELFTDELMRRAARFLREHLPGALPDPPGDDPELILAVDDLRSRAARGRAVSADEISHALLVLEHDRLLKEIRYLREHEGGAQMVALSARLQQVQTAIQKLGSRISQAQ
jgi:DNA primase